MAHLTINPGNADAWVVILKEGENTVGRADDNDVCLSEGGVSSHHCLVILDQGVVSVIDLNSTNGTLINGARITQAVWNPGQTIYFGGLPVRLEANQPVPVAAPIAAPVAKPVAAVSSPPIPVRLTAPATAPAAKGAVRLRIATSPTADAPPPVQEAPVAELPPPIVGGATIHAPPGTKCRSHPTSHARWNCPQCRRFYCDACVSTRSAHSGTHYLCRKCGGECIPVQVEAEVDAGERGFFARLPVAFIYPFRGMGVLTLIVATIVFALLGTMTGIFGIFSIVLAVLAIGYMFLFMQNIIYSTAAGDDEIPSLPDLDGFFGAFLTLVGTVLFCFGLPIGLVIAKFFDVEIPTSLLVGSIFLCWLYFPMAFLAVAMNDSVLAVNPLVVIPAILKVPLQYLVTTILLCGVFGVRLLGDSLSSVASHITMTTRSMSVMFMAFGLRALWSFFSMYLLIVGMRILGNLYVTQKEKLGWFRS